MSHIKSSLILTVKNEELTIGDFFNSLSHQTRQPDEIIIVDGGSTDKTCEILNSLMSENNKIRLIVQPGANIAKGRNIAIQNAANEIIAVTDGGCQLDENWLKNMLTPFENDPTIDVVSGWYIPDARNEFERCIAALTVPQVNKVLKIKDKFLPSSRSVAFKKECWKTVGGYPEWLNTAEDTLYDLNLMNSNYKFTFKKDAIVKWRMRTTLKGLFKQYYNYSKGDSEAKLFIKTYLIFYLIYLSGFTMLIVGYFIPTIWVTLVALTIIYLLIPTVNVLKRSKSIKSIFITPVLVVVIDMAKIFGYYAGKI
ncbi:MAG: glycosyltransferase [Methanomassiliicoccus sp.]|nr:glycosyltransferase [Methanomassiliicoccus sp.]